MREKWFLLVKMSFGKWVLFWGSWVVGMVTAEAEKLALVVGNNAYQYAQELNSPVADAQDVGAVLEKGGFVALQATDAGRGQMQEAIARLEREGKDAEVCLFYFSGHGLEVKGVNYLVPVEATREALANLTGEMVPLTEVLNALRETKARRKIVVLDCCRENPFQGKSQGLAALPSSSFPPGTLVVYAGAPGKPVPDGKGRNSPFTEELLRQLQPGRDVLSLFATVAAARFRTQDPWIKFDGSGRSFADLRSYHLLEGETEGLPGPKVSGGLAGGVTKGVVPKIASYWDHNGSTMGLLVEGKRRTLIYIKVRDGLIGLVQPGMVLFDGVSDGGRYRGMARRFSTNLPPIEYEVEGPILQDGAKVVLKGKAPIRNPDGTVRKLIDDRVEFTFLELQK